MLELEQKEEDFKWTDGGEFCKVFGETPRNKIIEEFLCGRGIDFPIISLMQETALDRTVVKAIVAELLAEQLIIPTRRYRNMQFYQLNRKNPKAQELLKVFDELLRKIGKEYQIPKDSS